MTTITEDTAARLAELVECKIENKRSIIRTIEAFGEAVPDFVLKPLAELEAILAELKREART